MPKEATNLFELAEGAEPPSDETLRKLDAPQREREAVASVLEASDKLCERLKFLQPESRLAIARHLVKGINSTTRMFNMAVFLRDKEEDHEAPLFETPPKTEDLFA